MLLFIFSEYSPIFLAISDTVKTTLPSQKYLHISLLWMAKFHAIPHPDGHLYPHLPLTHHSQPGSGYSSGSHRPILAEPLLLPGVMPDFASCLLSSSYALHPGVYWGKSEWNTAEQINIHREGMWGIRNHTAWMLGSSACDRRGKSKGKVHASEGQQLGPLISLYRVCLEKIRGDSHLNGGTKVRPQLTPLAPQAGHTCQETKTPESCQACGPLAILLTTWPRKHCRYLVICNHARLKLLGSSTKR